MVRSVLLGAAGLVTGLVLFMPAPAAAVNCKFVLKNLSTGRTVEQVAETMMIDVDDVKECQAEEEAKKAADAKAGEKAE